MNAKLKGLRLLGLLVLLLSISSTSYSYSVLTHQALCATMRREALFKQLEDELSGGSFTVRRGMLET